MFEYRRIAPDAQPMTDANLVQRLNSEEYISISGVYSGAGADRQDTHFVCLLLSETSAYGEQAPLYRKLFKGISANVKNILIVTPQDDISTHVAKVHTEYISEHKQQHVERSSYRVFLHELPKHVYVSPHRILSPEEVEHIEARWFIERKNLPKIKQHDPAAVWWGVRPGQVVEIRQLSSTVGNTFNWRYCE